MRDNNACHATTEILLFDRYNQAVQAYRKAVQTMASLRDEESFRTAERAALEARNVCDRAFEDLERYRAEHGC